SIKVNEIRYVAEDSSVAGVKIAANLTAKVLGAQGDKYKDFLEDPNRLLQMILAAEGSRGGGGSGPGGGGPGFRGGGGVTGGGGVSGGGGGGGTGHGRRLPGANLWDAGGGGGAASGSAASGGSGGPSGTGATAFPMLSSAAAALGAGPPPPSSKWLTASALLHSGSGGGGAEFTVQEEEIRSMLSLFAQLGRGRKDASGGVDTTAFQCARPARPVRSQVTLQQALAGLAAQA